MLEGVYDFHVHSSPDVVERKLTDTELAREARNRNMAGLVIKNHLFETAARAFIEIASKLSGARLARKKRSLVDRLLSIFRR